MTAYYNENNAFAAAWLRRLIAQGKIADGIVDTRSIAEVAPSDVRGYDQVHFFAGIGGWSLALRLAGVPDDEPVWTGSCPCQPFSSAGKHKGTADERHLWPEMFRLIKKCKPPVVIGEQVEAAVRHGWLDGVFADLEGEDYACAAVVLGAHSVGAPHIRQRLWWVADAASGIAGHGELQRGWQHGLQPQVQGTAERVGNTDSESGKLNTGEFPTKKARVDGANGGEHGIVPERPEYASAGVDSGGLADAEHSIWRPEHEVDSEAYRRHRLGWSGAVGVACRDGKTRRIEPGIQPLVNGLPGRLGMLRGYGNAIVPPLAAEFIKAFYEARP